jgi:CHAT domain-containing protein/predicted negative regulator of RcsB-dependent stress response
VIQQQDIRSIKSGDRVACEIKPNEKQTYQFAVGPGDYLQILVEQRTVNVALSFFGPDAKQLVDVNTQKFRQGIERVYWIAETPGNLRLEVRSLEKEAAGDYEIWFKEQHQATNSDVVQVQGIKAYWEGLRLGSQNDEASRSKAIEKYEIALKLFHEASDSQGEASALHRMGVLYSNSKQPQKALSYLDQAIPLYHAARDQQGEASALSDKGILFGSDRNPDVFDIRKASEAFELALPIARAVGDKEVEARILFNQAKLYDRNTGDFQKAIELYQSSLNPRMASGDLRTAASTLNNIGMDYFDNGEPYKALKMFDQAIPLRRVVGDREGEAGTLHNIAMDLYSVGDVQKALQKLDEATTIVKTNHITVIEPYTLHLKGNIFNNLGEYDRAIESYEKGLALARQLGLKGWEPPFLINMGGSYLDARDFEKARAAFNQALHLTEPGDKRDTNPLVLVQLAQSYVLSGDPRKALELLEQAMPLFLENDRRDKITALKTLGETYLSLNDPRKALAAFDDASHLGQSIDNAGETRLLLDMARAEKLLGNLVDAQKKIETALARIESYRSRLLSPELRATYFSTQQDSFYFYVDVLMALNKQQPAGGFDRQALEVSEARRARSLLESLVSARADIRQGVDPKLVEQEKIQGQSINAKQQFRLRLLSGTHSNEQVASVDKQIDALLADFRETQDRIRKASPRYAALTQPKTLAAGEVQQLLEPNTLLLEYSLGEERSYVWAVTNHSISSYELPKRSDIDNASKNFYGLLTARQPKRGESQQQYLARVAQDDSQYQRQASILSKLLLDPVADLLGTKRLLIVADGSLAYVPFAALPDKASSGQKSPLIADHEVVYLPSASTLSILRKEIAGRSSAPKAVAVFADPVFDKRDDRVSQRSNVSANAIQQTINASPAEQVLRDVGLLEEGLPLARLPFSREEAESIAALTPSGETLKALGFKASLTTVTAPEISRYRTVHFATHALVDPTRPYLSGLLLSLVDEQGKPQDGLLSLNQIYNLNLPADLVVLSACQTATGKDVKGEGIIGLTRGFMYAGSPRVLATLWKVDDAATAEMVKRLYRGMLKQKLQPAAALRTAQLEMLKHKLWSSPYYWAGFVLQGEPN